MLLRLTPIFAVLFLVLNSNPASAGYAAIVVDANTGRVLHARNADTPNFPASLTKMMTLFMAFEALKIGTLEINQPLVVSKRAAGQPASKLGLKAGETIMVDDALRALSVKSANDVATVIAEALGGTEVKFAQMMTARARELGMSRTSFRNASGLPNRRQKSTARDMSVLARALIDKHSDFYGYFSVSSFTHKGKTYRNHNKLLKDYAGTDGIKTGYIRASGFNLVASTQRDGIRLVGVVFGGKTASRRDRHMQSLLNKSWSRARAASTYAAKPIPKPTLALSGSVATALVNSPVPPLVVRRPASNWGIQIGAFAGYTDAHTAAGNAARRLTNLPQTASLKIQPVDETADTLYRARLMGMDEDYARASCHQLVRNGQPCALVTPQGNEMASLSSQ